MGKTIGFKQYQRGTRVQTVEETFNKGMSYTNAPLDEGYSRILLNLDINSDGGLQPRPGFVKKGAVVDVSSAYDTVVDSASIADAEGKSWQHTILGSTKRATDLYQIVQNLDTGEVKHNRLIPTVALGEKETIPIEDKVGVTYFEKKPVEIHDMPLTQIEHPVRSVVGCRAYNNDFYYIQDKHICHAGCLLTKDATETEAAEYEFTSNYITPKTCTPAGATTVGFNMLSQSPYTFENKCNTALPGGLVVTGLVAYTDEACTKPATTIRAGQEIWLRCYVEYPEINPENYSSLWNKYHITDTTTGVSTTVHYTTANIEFIFEHLKDTQYSLLGTTTTRPVKDTVNKHAYVLNHNDASELISIYNTARDKALSNNSEEYWAYYTFDYKNTNYEVSDIVGNKSVYSAGSIARFKTFTEVQTLRIIAPEDNPTFRCTVYTYATQANITASHQVGTTKLDQVYNSLNCPDTLYASAIVAPYQNTEQLRANMELKNYDLTKATGMAYWHERIVLWGIPEQANAIFFSDLRDPSYFPYPANTHYFNDAVVAAVPLLDNLVVFTETEVYIMSDVTTTATATITAQCIQRNLHIQPWDTHLIQPVKNMLFFKSGKYYYMIVPKANSTTGELTVATVSKPIVNFFDDFKNTIYNLLQKVYNYKKELELIHYYNYLDFEDIVNSYIFKAEKRYINVMVIYNSMTRAWSLRVIETPNIIRPVRLDATQRGVYGVIDGRTYTELEYSSKTLKDTYGYFVQNYQYYDSGYREHESNLKKRYREYQLMVSNLGQCDQEFYTGFYIDNSQREELFDYVVTPVYTTTKDGYPVQEYIIDSVPHTAQTIPGTTKLTTNPGSFKIGYSMFPEVSDFKLRFHTSGKGYAPRIVLYTNNFTNYALQSSSYVYRLLYSR